MELASIHERITNILQCHEICTFSKAITYMTVQVYMAFEYLTPTTAYPIALPYPILSYRSRETFLSR